MNFVGVHQVSFMTASTSKTTEFPQRICFHFITVFELGPPQINDDDFWLDHTRYFICAESQTYPSNSWTEDDDREFAQTIPKDRARPERDHDPARQRILRSASGGRTPISG